MTAPRLVSIGAVVQELGISPTRVRVLTSEGIFHAVLTGGGHRRYHLAETRAAWARYKAGRAGLLTEQGTIAVELPAGATSRPPTVDRTLELNGLQEDRVWGELVPLLDLEDLPPASALLRYVFTGMLNNAVDHSGGTRVHIRAWRSPSSVVIDIQDDGYGVFARLVDSLGLPDHFAAIQELTKGKRTTDPEHHGGEGIFFSSKAVDVFRLASTGLVWTVDNLRGDSAVGISTTVTGTFVRVELDPQTTRQLGTLFRQFTDDTHFTRTRPVVKLFSIGVTFVSRSEAKRLTAGLEAFTEVELDFTGVESVGQGFVDELFRVWPGTHPGTTLTPTNTNEAVAFMIARGLPQAN